MKYLVLTLSLVLSALTAQAQSDDNLPCDSNMGYRPGGSTLQEASHSFNTELQMLLNSCAVQKLVQANDANFYVKSFTHDRGTDTLKYSRTTFKNGIKDREFNCVLVQTIKPAQNPSTMADMDVERTHSCTDAENPKNFVCKNGWINCMPGSVSEENLKYCSQDYANWARKNCGGAPMIAQ